MALSGRSASIAVDSLGALLPETIVHAGPSCSCALRCDLKCRACRVRGGAGASRAHAVQPHQLSDGRGDRAGKARQCRDPRLVPHRPRPVPAGGGRCARCRHGLCACAHTTGLRQRAAAAERTGRVLHSRRQLRDRQCARLSGEPAGALFRRAAVGFAKRPGGQSRRGGRLRRGAGAARRYPTAAGDRRL